MIEHLYQKLYDSFRNHEPYYSRTFKYVGYNFVYLRRKNCFLTHTLSNRQMPIRHPCETALNTDFPLRKIFELSQFSFSNNTILVLKTVKNKQQKYHNIPH